MIYLSASFYNGNAQDAQNCCRVASTLHCSFNIHYRNFAAAYVTETMEYSEVCIIYVKGTILCRLNFPCAWSRLRERDPQLRFRD